MGVDLFEKISALGDICGVIFDADGTLLDSMGFWAQTVFDIIAFAGVKDPEDGLIELLTPMSMYEGAVYMRDNYAIPMDIDEIMNEENRRVLEFYSTRVELRSGMRELVSNFKAHGIPMTVASATERNMIETALTHTGILGEFEAVLSCSDVGQGKDQPTIFLRACEIMGTKPENTVVIEDSSTAIETARNAGFMTFDVRDS